MLKAFIAGFGLLLASCTTAPAGQTRLTDARSIARQFAETDVGLSMASLSRSGVLDDIDCNQETGVDAKQCNAFMTLMESRMEKLRADESKLAMADAADEIEALAVAMTQLSDADFSTLRTNANLPPGSDQIKPLSLEGEELIRQQQDALFASLSTSDSRAGDRVQALVMEILAKMMSDPSLQ
jgi:hypothetical protein